MAELCSNTWGAPWGVYFPPCDPVDPVDSARGRARQRMLEDTTFAALVQLVGESMADIEFDAWQLLHRITPGTATGALLEQWGEDLGFPKPSLLWDSTRYRLVMGAWLPAQMGAKSIPKLLTLLDALADGETCTVGEYFPSRVVVDVTGLDGDRATIWAQVLEAARPKTVQFWLTYAETSSTGWLLGTSTLGVDTWIAGTLILGG